MAVEPMPKRMNPDELALTPSYKNTWFNLALSAGVLIFALWFWRSLDPVEFFWSRIIAVLAVAGIGACAYALLRRSGRGLFLDRRGFRISTAWRTRAYRWSDVGAFHVTSDTDGVKSVAFAANGSPSRTTVGKVARWLSHTTLPGNYRMQAEVLAALMNEWRKRGIGSASQGRARMNGG